MLWESFGSDLRLAVRNALRRPAFTALVALTLALGIGVSSAVFAVVDGVLLRRLPYRDPSRLLFVWQTLPSKNVFELEPTPFDHQAWHRLHSLAGIAMILTDSVTLSGDNTAERVRGARVTASLMPLLGIAPHIGRAFTPNEDSDAAAPVAILSDGLWRRRYGADPEIVGRDIGIDGENHTVVGVMPPGALLPGHVAANSEIWLPARMSAAQRDNAISHNYTVVGRLAAGVSIDAASLEIDAFARRMAEEHPDSHANLGARLTSVEEETVRAIRPSLLVLAVGVVLLLCVAAANAVTLVAARAAARQHETAVRTALGAPASRLFSLALAESLVHVMAGGLSGLALGSWTLHGLAPLFAGNLPPSATIGVDARVAVFTAAVSFVLSILMGFVVAAQTRGRVADALRTGARTATATPSTARTRALLVVTQVSFAVLLLAAAGLMLDSVARLSRVSAGFDAASVLSFRVSLTGSPYESAAQRMAFVSTLTERLAASNGATAAGVTSAIPFGGARGANGVEVEGRPAVRGAPMIIDQRHVTPDYFAVMGIRVLEGRALRQIDDARAERVTVINRTMARKYWPNESPIDRRVRITAGFGANEWLRIVGVVDDVRHISLSREYVPEMYRPYAQAAVPTFTVVVRASTEPAALASIARSVVGSIDAGVPIYDVQPMSDRVAASFAQTRGTMSLLAVVAVLAASLASVAVYGSIWYSVSQRMPEIAIRIALGASRASVCADVVGRAMVLTGTGAAVGAAAALASGPLLRTFLFEARPTNPAASLAAAAAMVGLTAVASILPARRAMRVDPASALREPGTCGYVI